MNISESFTCQKFAADLKHLKQGKAPGPDLICPKLITHVGAALKSWLCGFLTSCLRHLKIPKVWRRALAVPIPKSKKPVKDPKSYHPISLLCVLYKILEWLIHARNLDDPVPGVETCATAVTGTQAQGCHNQTLSYKRRDSSPQF